MKKKASLSSFDRASIVEKLQSRYYDLVIVGGGITGAGIALDAASRGLKCCVIEKQDFGAGTSSRSTKLIHGGLRYLKQLEIGLVREVGRERAILHQNVPHLVHPKQLILPIIENGSLGGNSTSVGLYVYDLLAGVKREERREMLSKEEVLAIEPLLNEEVVEGAGKYYEYMTDDARLVIEAIKTAASFGAQSINYTEAEEFLYDLNQKVIGVKVRDAFLEQTYSIYGKTIVNACGPWVDTLREKDKSLKGKHLKLTKGVHIVVPHEKLPINQLCYFDVNGDNRMIFAIPRAKVTYIGTTDTFYENQLERPDISQADVDYLLSAVNFIFPQIELSKEDVVSSWSGLRPLIHEEGKDPSELSRKDEIFNSETGLISIAGGKLTGFRKMAERVVDQVIVELRKQFGHSIELSETENIRFSGSEDEATNHPAQFIEDLFKNYHHLGLSHEQLKELFYKYGCNTATIVASINDIDRERADSIEQKLLLAELRYGIEHEMVNCLSDFLIRRTGRLYFDRENLAKIYPFLLDEIALLFDWSSEQKMKDLEEFEKEYKAVLDF